MNTYKLSIIVSAAALAAACSKPQQMTLQTATIAKTDISEVVTATGTVESVTTVDVGTQVTGIISALYADYNTEVKAGQLIAEIDKTVLESTLRSANANMESARLTYEYTKTNYERDTKLHDKQLISDYEYDTSRRDYLVAKATYEKTQADRVGAQRNLSYAEIYAPIDGIVISRQVEVGQTVVSSMSVANLFTIADLDHMRVIADVDEADIGQVATGQRVEFTVDAYPNDKFAGTVTQVRLSPTTESNVVTYEVVVDADNADHKLIPGLTANITIYTLEARNQIAVPVKAFNFTPQDFSEDKTLPGVADSKPAVAADATHKNVYVLRDNVLYPTAVEIGIDNGVYAIVKSGLSEGDVVATDYEAEADNAAGPDDAKSPFMPSRPKDNKKK
ncbi:MAG: efflux RND transporter periplasmic adaptor subunit [Muribaculaceae bacterium]